jgi:hypothetical protein
MVRVGVQAVVEARTEVQPDVSLNLVAATMIADRPHRLIPLVAALSLLPATARAQPSDPNRATARTLANEGQEAFDKGDYKTAVDRFARADALYHAPTLLLALAHAQIAMGKLVSASETYNRIVSEGAPPRSPQAFVKAVEDATKELAALEVRIASLIIDVHGSDAAAVTIDDTPVPGAALGVKRPTDPGEHVLRATAPGFRDAQVSITLAEGATRNVTLELKPVGVTPPSDEKPGLGSGSPQKTLGIAVAGVGGAGLLMGGITGFIALNQHGKLVEACGPTRHCPVEQKDALDSFHTVSTVSTIGFAVGGAALATGVVLILTAPRAKPAPPVDARARKRTRSSNAALSLTPQIGAGYIGVAGRF